MSPNTGSLAIANHMTKVVYTMVRPGTPGTNRASNGKASPRTKTGMVVT